jgi:hypothetical protein
MAYFTQQRIEGSDMKRVMVALMVLLLAGVIVSSGAFSIPSSLSGLSGLNIPSLGSSLSSVPSSLGSYSTPSSSLGGFSMPSSGLGGFSTPSSSLGMSVPSNNLQVSTPAQNAFSNWNLDNMEFFSPSNHASAQPVSGLPGSDIQPILDMLSQMPTSDQMAQYYGSGSTTATATPTPNATDTFTEVSSTIPADKILFIEVSRNQMLTDPTTQGIIVPNVTMNYKFSDSSKNLVLKRKPGMDYNSSQIIFGFSDSDDVNNRYVFDYNVGSSLGVDVQVLFHGADGRVRISVDGVQKDLKPGEKYEAITTEGNIRTVLDVANWGLIPKANVNVSDTI